MRTLLILVSPEAEAEAEAEAEELDSFVAMFGVETWTKGLHLSNTKTNGELKQNQS